MARQSEIGSVASCLNSLNYLENRLQDVPEMVARIAVARRELQMVQATLALLETSDLALAVRTGTDLAVKQELDRLL